MLEFRKHLGWYTKGLPDGRRLRQELFQVRTLEEARERLEGYARAWAATEGQLEEPLSGTGIPPGGPPAVAAAAA